jgi:hypothetical protein
MSTKEREKKRMDVVIKGTTAKQKLTTKELQQILLTHGITVKWKLTDMQKAVTNLGTPIKQINNKIKEGRKGKSKGLLQVLWERG